MVYVRDIKSMCMKATMKLEDDGAFFSAVQ
jgi:hypothetical protein